MGEHTGGDFLPPISLYGGLENAEVWSTELHTKASPTNAFGTIDFEDTASRVCRAKVGGPDSYIPVLLYDSCPRRKRV